jgi:hypothetical protein
MSYYLVQCPCEKANSHTHKISNPDVIGLITPRSLNQDIFSPTNLSTTSKDSNEKNIKIFYYTCEESNHKCQVWIDTDSGRQKISKCKICDI